MTGYVYAIESGAAVKIGFANSPTRRLSELNVGSPDTHRLLGYVEATMEQEKEIHELCAPDRIRGEWFAKSGRYVRQFLEMLPACEDRAKSVGAPKVINSPMEHIRKNVFRASQSVFAEIAGVTQATVSRWEAGGSEPYLPELLRIRAKARLLRLEWDDDLFFVIPEKAAQ